MIRPDGLHENRLQTMLTDLRTDLDALKTAQRVSGASGIKGYNVQSASTWDYQGTIGSDSDTGLISTSYVITFTGDGTQSPVIANLGFLVYVNGNDAAHQLTPTQTAYVDGSGRKANIYYDVTSESQLVYTAQINLLTLKQITIYIKAFAIASSGGTVTVQRTA